jgi:beta-lactamase superfamily II metal-dependent hydrolase
MSKPGVIRSFGLCLVIFLAAGCSLDEQEPVGVVGPENGTFDIYIIDVEGGGGSLFVSPSGESLLYDGGWPGFDGRDVDRIAAAAEAAGIEQIDYFVLSHFHGDHIGDVAQISERLPIRHFVDTGIPVDVAAGEDPRQTYLDYAETRSHVEHTVARPGMIIEMGDVNIQIIAAGGDVIETPLPGGGELNPYCEGFVHQGPEVSEQYGFIEDAASVGMYITYGDFSTAKLGDANTSVEFKLMCPVNKLGSIDLYLVSRHGMEMSNSEALVYAPGAKVAIMNNGPNKGGAAQTFETLRDAPGLEDLWLNHYSIPAGDELNPPADFIANLDNGSTPVEGRGLVHMGPANWIKVSAEANGEFTVTNSRNGYSKRYEGQD